MANPTDFAQYVQSVTSLDALEKMADVMDKDIEESQKLMDELKNIFHSLPSEQRTPDTTAQHEDVLKFLDAKTPQLLMDDMTSSSLDVDLEPVISMIKNYKEELKRDFPSLDITTSTSAPPHDEEMSSLDLNNYANSLEQLRNRFGNIKLSTAQDKVSKKDAKLEELLTRICKDVDDFCQMAQAKTRVAETNEQRPGFEQNTETFQFNEVFNQMVSLLNEATSIMKNNQS